jgi:hypothetical protein
MTPLDILVDLFGSGPEDLHGAVIIDPAGVAQLVVERLAQHGYQIVAAEH